MLAWHVPVLLGYGLSQGRPVWHALQRRVDDLLAGISVADLMKDEAQVQELVGISVAG